MASHWKSGDEAQRVGWRGEGVGRVGREGGELEEWVGGGKGLEGWIGRGGGDWKVGFGREWLKVWVERGEEVEGRRGWKGVLGGWRGEVRKMG